MLEDVMTAEKTIAALAALAHEHRLAAFRLLVEAGPNGMAAGLVAERLGIPPSSLTFHLQQLLRAGLVTQRRLSRQLIYATDFGTMNSLVAYLTENCCGQADSGVCATPVCKPGARTAKGRASPKRESA
jgi:DNA-binding transcriptional ArsR family regulator